MFAARRLRVPGDLQVRMLTYERQTSPAGAQLTDAQEHAVARRGESLLLAAGAGSGKTSVLVERFARAVLDDGIGPTRILAITFTERAAAELRERVASRLRVADAHAAARELEGAYIGTFHGFCARLVRAHGALAGTGSDFSILEERLAGWLRSQAFALALRELLTSQRADAVELVAAYGAERIRAMTLDAYATLRSRGERHPRLPLPAAASVPAAGADPATVAGATGAGADVEVLDAPHAVRLFDELLADFGRKYEQLKQRRGALDFDDLELVARELLEQHEDVRTATAARFELLMVDEFQDCNARELAIVEALERDNLFTVGDEQQAIYGFRHADVRLFKARRAALDGAGASLRLSENFRSRGDILDFVNGVFSARLGERFDQLVAARELDDAKGGMRAPAHEVHAPTLFDAPCEPRVELLLTCKRGWEATERTSPLRGAAPARTTPLWRVAEARALAERVHELVHDGGVRGGEIAVLLRALGDCETYEAALRERGLRTIAPAGSFWSREQVCDLVAYLRALANPLDDVALYSTLASPLAGVSRGGLAALARAGRARGRSVWDVLRADDDELHSQLRDQDGEALRAFGERLARERSSVRRRSISRALERALDSSGYREHVLAQTDGGRRLANVHKFLSIAREFEAREGRDLRAFLDYVAVLADRGSASEAEAPVAAQGSDAVTLLSIHAAKGLEFPVVCVADLGRAPNMSVPDLLVDGDSVGLRLVSLEHDEVAPALDFADLAAERRRAQCEEEDRILYVAMTRARDRLVLSGALDLERPPRPREDEPPIAWLVRALDPERSDIAALVRRSINAPGDRAAGGPPSAEPACAGAPLATGAAASGPVSLIASAPAPAPAPAAAMPTRLGAPATDPGSPRGDTDAPAVDALAPARDTDAPAADTDAPSTDPGGPSADAPAGAPAIDAAAPAADALAPATDSPASAAQAAIGSLSYTALAELERCSYRYYLERVLGLAEHRAGAESFETSLGQANEGATRVRTRTHARARGMLVHRVLETAGGQPATRETAGGQPATRENAGGQPATREMRETTREQPTRDTAGEQPATRDRANGQRGSSQPGDAEVGAAARQLGLSTTRKEREEVARLVRRARAPEGLFARLKKARSVCREHAFAFALGEREPLIGGVIDVVAYESEDRVLIVDYKTDRVGAEEDVEELTEREYSLQRLIYALALLRAGAAEVEIVHWFLEREDGCATARFAAGERVQLEERLRERVDGALEAGFAPSEHPHRALCAMCPGRGGLCSWSDAETLRD